MSLRYIFVVKYDVGCVIVCLLQVHWTAEEDALLTAGVHKYGTEANSWVLISAMFNGTREYECICCCMIVF